LEVICEDQRAKRLEYVKKVVAIANQQSFEEASQFFKGYAALTTISRHQNLEITG
jgi:hypothetical protein